MATPVQAAARTPRWPNFLVIGASRSGTTTLYHHLAAHPDVYVTPVMEPRFFAFEGDPLCYRGPGDDLLRRRVVTSREAYVHLFDGANDATAVGEVSPAYLSSESAPARIRRYIPDAKLIVILRNPIERALSSFRLERLEGFESVNDLAEALRCEPVRMRSGWSYVWGYKARGMYFTQLQRYFSLFPREQFMLRRFEDWGAPDAALVRSVFRFLDVDDGIDIPEGGKRHNSTDPARFAARGRVRYVPSSAVLAELADAYRDEIAGLGALTGWDLSSWLDPATWGNFG